jgi:hypothetical protein
LTNYRPLTSINVTDYGTYKTGQTTYKDNLGLGIEVKQVSIAKTGDNFFILEYTVTNRRSSQIDNLYLGSWHDFDIKANILNNLDGYDGTNNLAYMYDGTNPSGTYAGIRLLDSPPVTFKRFGNNLGRPANTANSWLHFLGSNVIDNPLALPDLQDDYQVAEAYGPYNGILPNQSVKLAFAVVVGTGLSSIQGSSANAQIFYDFWKAPPPTVSNVNAPNSTPNNQTFNVTVQASDPNNGIAFVNLYYKKGGDASFTTIVMTNTGGNNWSGSVPANFVTEKGVEFYIVATGGNVGKTASTTHYSVQVTIPNISRDDPNTGVPVYQPQGTTVSAYQLFSVPLILDNPSASAFVSANPALGTQDPKKWRWADFDRNSRQFIEFPNFTNINPDHGYLLIVNLPNFQIGVSSGKTVRTDQNYSYGAFPQGWNVIGNPFNYDVPKDSILVSVGTYELWSFNNGSWTQSTVTGMRAWTGYAVYLTSPAIMTIHPSRSGLSKDRNPFNLANADQKNWFIQITAKLKDTEDVFNYVGQNEKASNKYDAFDLHKPPSIGEDVRLQIYHPDWTTQNTEAFATDVHQLNAEGQFFDFSLVTKAEDGIGKLTFDGIQNVPPEFLVYLVDKVSGASTNLKSNKAYSFAPALSGKKEYRLLAGTKDFVERYSAGANLFPTEYKLAQNYPNPFNPTTTIQYAVPQTGPVKLEIFNVLGQRVKTLVDENQSVSNYTVIWDSKNDHGIVMPSGVYFYRIIAGKFVQTKKMVLMK